MSPSRDGIPMRRRTSTLASAAVCLREHALRALAKISPMATAHLDWLWSSNHQSWGGPMNGQEGRRELVRQIANIIDLAAVVETGTFRGTTTEFLWHVTGAPVFTVEIQPRFHRFAQRRFSGNPAIRVDLTDSVAFLRRLADDPAVPKQRVLFYFDAHWGRELPLQQELALVQDHWTDSIVIVDDFEVPGDPGYGFDDFGPGLALRPEYLATSDLAGLSVLYPTLPSEQETGARRGCCVIASTMRAEDLLRGGVPLAQPAAELDSMTDVSAFNMHS
jgi:hypothetical protein